MSTVVKDMALTPEDFFRGLKTALRGRDYRVDGHTVTTGTGDRGVSISIRPLPPRLLGGLLSVAHCEVTISFRGCPAHEQTAFLAAFDQAYQRGGG